MKRKVSFIYVALMTAFLLTAAVPVLFTLGSIFFHNGHLTAEHLLTVLGKDKLALLGHTCLSSLIVSLLANLLGGGLGYLLGKTDIPYSRLLKLLFLIPLFVSPYFFAVAWRDVFQAAGITYLQGKTWVVIFIHVLCFFPLPMLIISHASSQIHRSMIEAGLLYTNRFKVGIHLELPLIKHAIFSSLLLTFILSASEMTVATYFLVSTFMSEIFIQFSAFYNHAEAIAHSLLLVVLCMVLIIAEYPYLVKAPFLATGSKGNRPDQIKLGHRRMPLFALLLGCWALITLLPVSVLGIQAFEPPPEFVQIRNEVFKTEGAGIRGYYVKQAIDMLEPVLAESVIYALLGSIITVVLGFVFAYHVQRYGQKLPQVLTLLLFAIPATILGIGLIQFYNRPVLEVVYSSFLIIAIVYMARFTFIALNIIRHAIGKVPHGLEEVAALCGIPLYKRIYYILLPLIAPGIFVALIISFVFCLSETGAVIVVYPPGSSLLPIKIATAMHSTPEGLMSAMVFVALVITLSFLGLLFAVYHMLSRKYAWTPV